MGFKDINYDTPVCRECHEVHHVMNINAQRTQHATCAIFIKCRGFKDIKYDGAKNMICLIKFL